MNYDLRPYQIEGRNLIREQKKVALFWSMGLGKTLTVLDALHHDMLPALIVAPLRVAKYVWPEEIEQFKFPYSYSFVHGSKKDQLLEKMDDIKIINPEGLAFLFDRLKGAGKVPFKSVIVDESSLYKNVTTKRWKHLRGIIDGVPYRVLLTGTPGLAHDMYGQISLLDDRLGRYRDFEEEFFDFDYFGRPVPKDGAIQRISEIIRPVVNEKHVTEELSLPPISSNFIFFDLNAEARRLYDQIDEGIEDINENSYMPLRTTCSGFIYTTDQNGQRLGRRVHEEKLNILQQVLDDTNDNLLVVTNFREERSMIHQKFLCPYIDGETKPADEAAAIQDWNNGKLRLMTMHPRSLGHGVRLERGGNQVLWFSLPDSYELYEQSNARIWRAGQKKPVMVHHLVADNTIETVILRLLRNKVLSATNLLAELKRQRTNSILS